jgi:hypothetical protein
MHQVSEAFTRVLGRPIRYVQTPWDVFQKTSDDYAFLSYKWLNEFRFLANIPALRSEHPNLMLFKQYLCTHDWKKANA